MRLGELNIDDMDINIGTYKSYILIKMRRKVVKQLMSNLIEVIDGRVWIYTRE